MGNRAQLHTPLCGTLGRPRCDDAYRAYSQPPTNKEIRYLCIIYERGEINVIYTDNASYRLPDRYQVTAIYKNSDSDLSHRLAMLSICARDHHFMARNLNHDTSDLYY